MKFGGKKQKSLIRGSYNWNGSTLLGGGGVNSVKLEKDDVFLTYEGVIGSS